MRARKELGEAAMDRRAFLGKGLAGVGYGLCLTGCDRGVVGPVPGRIHGAGQELGHGMRDRSLPGVSREERCQVVVVGAGIAGLAAARELWRAQVRDVVVLELEDECGGNSRAFQHTISGAPWGAHYVPLPGPELTEVRDFFEQCGVIQGRNAAGLPIYDEEVLCADPMERLHILGRWQEGLIPQFGLLAGEKGVLAAFFEDMDQWKSRVGRDGRTAFELPVDRSSRDEDILRLDGMTMWEYLVEKGWGQSRPLRWYVDYCCRDDYGAGVERVSAWAGIHYFASRHGQAANAPSHSVLTWPEGNGWIVRELKKGMESRLKTGCAVWNAEVHPGEVVVDYYDVARRASVRLRAGHAVVAVPRFVAARWFAAPKPAHAIPIPDLMPGAKPDYAPWLVANIALKSGPETVRGFPLAWDNVIYESRSLGYVVATHQSPRMTEGRTVLTYYRPMDETDSNAGRRTLMEWGHGRWCEEILRELTRVHPGLERSVESVDLMFWGHGMICPRPGFVWGDRLRWPERVGRLRFAHSDMSGMSLFEEAFTRGCRVGRELVSGRGVLG